MKRKKPIASLTTKASYPEANPGEAMAGKQDDSEFEVLGTMNLSNSTEKVKPVPRKPYRNDSRKKKRAQAKAALKKDADLSNIEYALPESQRYPIHDEAHARHSLMRSKGRTEHAIVKAAVNKKYPKEN